MSHTWQNGRKVQAITWLTTCCLVSFVSLTAWAAMHPEMDRTILVSSLAFLSIQTGNGISFLMGQSAPEQIKPPTSTAIAPTEPIDTDAPPMPPYENPGRRS